MRIGIQTTGLSAREWLAPLLRALVALNREWLKAAPETPALYASGVRYESEPIGTEEWATIPTVLARGVGDCEDLAAWRCAELQARGIAASIEAVQRPSPLPGLNVWHVVVRLPGGRIEDPSRRLGMPADQVA